MQTRLFIGRSGHPLALCDALLIIGSPCGSVFELSCRRRFAASKAKLQSTWVPRFGEWCARSPCRLRSLRVR